jgi:tetratricopeptide (TPR) repeat protein
VYRDAAEHYKRAIDKAPEMPDLYYRYAHALWAAGDVENSLAQYKRAAELNPYDYRPFWEQARIQLSENPEEAVKLSTRALELRPDVAEALMIRGVRCFRFTNPRKGPRISRRLSRSSPTMLPTTSSWRERVVKWD